MIKKLLLGLVVVLTITNISAQENLERWFHMDASEGYQGVSSDIAYKELLSDKSSTPVIVAIIDSGVDIEHEDLKDVIWVNKGEIPNNNKDDDNNGYIDDVYGWNFIGGPDGRSVNDETYEVTRLYAKYKYKFENADPEKLNKKDKKLYDKYIVYKKEVEKKTEEAMDAMIHMTELEGKYITSINAFTDKYDTLNLPYTLEAVSALELTQEDGAEASVGQQITISLLESESSISDKESLVNALKTALAEDKKRHENKLKYAYNPDYDSRKSIVKDNYEDQNERYYGNNDVEGPDALHGTHVAGIVGAVRNNGIGMDGIADNVQIMSIRTVPNGDERDKDVANAIRYAVDNGASIINMSFGKGYSWNKGVVDDAVKYAVKKDVLLVHAAGNSSLDIDKEDNFPNDRYEKVRWCLFGSKREASTWIEVGALSHEGGEKSVANFSNYGVEQVDIFAPGVQIYATLPDDKYRYLRGTSMAAPVVAGVAAVLRSYFPKLTAKQVKKIIITTGTSLDLNVIVPGTEEKVPFAKLSKSGKVVNLYNAVKKAMVTKGKKKIKK